jgi:hypothetical protein
VIGNDNNENLSVKSSPPTSSRSMLERKVIMTLCFRGYFWQRALIACTTTTCRKRNRTFTLQWLHDPHLLKTHIFTTLTSRHTFPVIYCKLYLPKMIIMVLHKRLARRSPRSKVKNNGKIKFIQEISSLCPKQISTYKFLKWAGPIKSLNRLIPREEIEKALHKLFYKIVCKAMLPQI